MQIQLFGPCGSLPCKIFLFLDDLVLISRERNTVAKNYVVFHIWRYLISLIFLILEPFRLKIIKLGS